MVDLFDMLFGCWHKHYSFPITAKKGQASTSHAANVTGTYVVCLDCGKEFPYDWKEMRVLSSHSAPDKGTQLGSEAPARLAKVA